MAGLTSILREIRGLNSDRGRDRLPDGAVWELTDWVPEVMQAGARGRGRWLYQSDVLPNVADGSIYAPFRSASKLLIANGTNLADIPTSSVGSSSVGTIPQTRQDPVFFLQTVVVPALNGTAKMRYITLSGTTYSLTDAPVSAPTARFCVPWKGRLVVANTNAAPTDVWFSQPASLTSWVAVAHVSMPYDVTGLAAQKNQVLVFHNGNVSRIRGTTPPDDSIVPAQAGDLIVDSLFDRAGCYDARSIAYWNENVIFADTRGVFLTDGAAVRNLCLQGAVLNLWQAAWERGSPKVPPTSVAGVVFRDYYVVTIRHGAPLPPVTFVIEVPTRRVFMLTNIDTPTFASSLGMRERVWAVQASTKRVINLSYIFEPDATVLQIDEDGTPVLPVLSTGWNRLSKEESFKRIVDLHLSYEAHRDTDDEVLRMSYTRDPAYTIPAVLREFKTANYRQRKRMSVNRRLEGVAVTIQQLLPTKDSRFYDLSVRAYGEEETHL